MRDLARSGLINKRGYLAKVVWRLLIVGVVALIAVTYLRSSRFVKNTIGSPGVVLQDAPRGLTPVSVSLQDTAKTGVDLTTQTATLVDVKFGGRASGVATRTFGGGSYILSIQISVPDTKGYLFEVWLVDKAGVLREVDFMKCTQTSCLYDLRDSDKYSRYNTIWITREITNQDNKPEQHVLEGKW